MKRRGMAMVCILAFAVAMSMLLFVLVQSNSNVTAQNRRNLRQMQAHFLALSGIQHAKVKLRLLPKETMEAFQAGLAPYPDVDSDLHADMMVRATGEGFTLFQGDPPRSANPYTGRYLLQTLVHEAAHEDMALVQDAFAVEIDGTVTPRTGERYTEKIRERLFVSRWTGGI